MVVEKVIVIEMWKCKISGSVLLIVVWCVIKTSNEVFTAMINCLLKLNLLSTIEKFVFLQTLCYSFKLNIFKKHQILLENLKNS